MRRPKTDKWDENEELDGLLLFAQLIDEMLFDYTIGSYKPPVLNTHSLCEELSGAIDEVKDGFIKEKSIDPLKEELIWSLKNDPAAKSILGNRYSAILDYLCSSNNYNHIISTINTVKNLLDLNYSIQHNLLNQNLGTFLSTFLRSLFSVLAHGNSSR